MKAVAIEELETRLSACLREVRGGEVVLVTDRGRVVAEPRQPSPGTPLAPHERAVAAADLLDAERRER